MAWVLALGAAFFYGTALVLTQLGLRDRTPFDGASISVPTAAVFFLLLSPVLVDFSNFDPVAFSVFVGIGVLFPGTVTLLTFVANGHMGPNLTGAIGNLTPLFAVLFAITILGESFGLTQAVGISVIIAGVTLLTFSRKSAGTTWPLWAILLPFGGAVIRGIMQPGIKWGLTLWPDPFAAVTIGYAISAILILGVAQMRKQPEFVMALSKKRSIASTYWFVAVGLCNGGAVLLTYRALAVGDVILISPLIATYPFITLILSAVILRNTSWSWHVVVGILATVAGVAFILGGG